MRLDRSLTLFLRAYGWTGFPCGGLPILMYHSVSDDPEFGIRPYYRVATSPQQFARQMSWLADLGYKGVSVEEALTMGPDGERQMVVAITFDDGFRDFYTAAWPVLSDFGFTATMYLPTSFIGQNGSIFRGKECLSWGQVRELRARGIRFGSHSATHPKLYGMPWEMIDHELTISKQRLEDELGEKAGSFAYPYAFPQEDRRFTGGLTELLRERGYRHCVTTVIGRARVGVDDFCLKRLPVNQCDDRELLMAKLEGAYDWLGAAQRACRGINALRQTRPSFAARRST